MTASEPAFYNDLNATLGAIRSKLEEGCGDRHSAAHTPVFATTDENSAPRPRILILRDIDWEQRRCRFHTDVRTAKIDQLRENASASVLIYDGEAKVQIRLSGSASVEHRGPIADAAWSSSTLFARRCYLAENAPGSPSEEPTSGLSPSVEGRKPTEEEVEQGRKNFAIILFTFDEIDWLYLANAGHRRAHYRFVDGDWKMSWAVP